MKIKFLGSCFFLTLCTSNTVFSQSDLQKMLNSANNIKKNSPAKNTPAQQGPPPGYDLSWKVMVSLTRTMTVTTDLISTTSTPCRATKKGSYQLTVTGNFSSNKTAGWINEDDFTLITYGGSDDQLKPYLHPFSGAFSGNSNGSLTETGCDAAGTTVSTANGNVDLPALPFTFYYNSKRKEGSFNFSPGSNHTTEATGKMSWHGKSGSGTANTSDQATNEFNLMFGVCSEFGAFNYQVAKDTRTQQMLQSSPLNGSMASIGETKYGYDISYSEAKTIDDVPNGWTGTSRITYTTNVHIQITDQDPPEYDAIVQTINYPSLLETEDYKTWIPEGPPIPDTAQHNKKPSADQNHGNSIAFRVYIVDKKNPNLPITGRKFRVEYMLTSSKIKGICMNYPQEKDADNKPDLIFDSLFQKSPQNGQESYANDALKSKADEGENFIAIITSYDYGSYGSLKIKVTIKDDFGVEQQPIWAHLKDDKRDTVYIPFDDNHNHIADEWEKHMGILKKNLAANSDDDDKPDGLNKDYKGDGFTAYEEYRGFSENAKHIRTDPTTRDVMVCNRLKNITDSNGTAKNYHDRAENGFSLYQGVTGMNVHYKFRAEEFGRHVNHNPYQNLFTQNSVHDPFLYDKVLNFNDENENGDVIDHSVDQHGILIVFSTMKDGTCASISISDNKKVGTPGDMAFLYIAQDFNPTWKGYYATSGNISEKGKVTSSPSGKAEIITDFFAVTVAHEMLHCSNVPHHGDGDLGKMLYIPSDDGQSLICSAKTVNGNIPVRKEVRLFVGKKEILPSDPILKNPVFLDYMLGNYVGVQNGESSGNENCIMRYSVDEIYEKNGNHYTLKDITDFKTQMVKNLQLTGTSLCTSSDGTGINAPPHSIFGNATNGNCKAKVKVNDKEQ